MASQIRPSKRDESSIKYYWIPLEVQSFKLDNISSEGDEYARSVSCKINGSQSEAKSSTNRVSTSKLVSAAAGIWNCIGQPAVFQTKGSFKYDEISQKVDITCYSDNRKKHSSTSSVDNENICNDLPSDGRSLSTAKSNFEDLKKIKKILLFASCNRNINSSIIWSNPHSHVDSPGTDEVASIGVSSDYASRFGSMMRKNSVQLTGKDGKDESSMSEKKSSPTDLSATQSTERSVTSEGMDPSGGKTMNLSENVLPSPSSLYSTYSVQPLKSSKEAIIVLRSPTSVLHSDDNSGLLTVTDCALRQQATDSYNMVAGSSMEVSSSEDHSSHENGKSLFREPVREEECSAKHQLCLQDILQKAFAKNRHALAGALAGTLVSLCLHPVDTVKTVIQANGMGQKSSCQILRTIISENGAMGLYRGIASNITSSAPISAIYTYTYESVKGALLPLFPKEYHSFAHCIAGGCSSIATSVIFTPSEHIKQQMQVGSQYRNCWNALIACLEKGGVQSLYTGWGAVLCRNVPHSIIKFYTYERLKQLILTSTKSDTSLNTLQTLVCGGLAGSTAALFTTPFDVVKTRLQTQAPGSLAKYNGVLHALQEIARQEGLQGLYRGLTPRLAMYVSQGAIFFASYEFLKAALSLEAPRAPVLVIKKKHEADDPTP